MRIATYLVLLLHYAIVSAQEEQLIDIKPIYSRYNNILISLFLIFAFILLFYLLKKIIELFKNKVSERNDVDYNWNSLLDHIYQREKGGYLEIEFQTVGLIKLFLEKQTKQNITSLIDSEVVVALRKCKIYKEKDILLIESFFAGAEALRFSDGKITDEYHRDRYTSAKRLIRSLEENKKEAIT